MITLHIGKELTVVCDHAGARSPAVHTLPLGYGTTAIEHFRHDPPTPLEMENAIMAVEDVLMPLHKTLAAGETLTTADPAVREIALLAGVADGPEMVLGLDALERVFNALASVVMGSPASQANLPAGSDFAATVLILREFMHHLKFASITVVAASAAA